MRLTAHASSVHHCLAQGRRVPVRVHPLECTFYNSNEPSGRNRYSLLSLPSGGPKSNKAFGTILLHADQKAKAVPTPEGKGLVKSTTLFPIMLVTEVHRLFSDVHTWQRLANENATVEKLILRQSDTKQHINICAHTYRHSRRCTRMFCFHVQ